jgi:hypothetical protein
MGGASLYFTTLFQGIALLSQMIPLLVIAKSEPITPCGQLWVIIPLLEVTTRRDLSGTCTSDIARRAHIHHWKSPLHAARYHLLGDHLLRSPEISIWFATQPPLEVAPLDIAPPASASSINHHWTTSTIIPPMEIVGRMPLVSNIQSNQSN